MRKIRVTMTVFLFGSFFTASPQSVVNTVLTCQQVDRGLSGQHPRLKYASSAIRLITASR
jgi:hypothetical protein